MPVAQLILSRLLQSVVPLSVLSHRVLPADVQKVSSRQNETDPNGSNVDRMACNIIRGILAEVSESRDKRSTVSDRDHESETCGFDVVRS